MIAQLRFFSLHLHQCVQTALLLSEGLAANFLNQIFQIISRSSLATDPQNKQSATAALASTPINEISFERFEAM